MNQDHSMDGIDPDSPENQKLATHKSRRHPEAAAMVRDYEELESMSEADKRRYAGGA